MTEIFSEIGQHQALIEIQCHACNAIHNSREGFDLEERTIFPNLFWGTGLPILTVAVNFKEFRRVRENFNAFLLLQHDNKSFIFSLFFDLGVEITKHQCHSISILVAAILANVC